MSKLLLHKNQIPATYLYIKEHRVTGLKYFGKTTQDPFLYKGSGTRWSNHIQKHGYDVETTILGCYTDRDTISKVATDFSIRHNIVESKDWANCRIENGLDGGSNGPHSIETKKLISERTKGKLKSEETRLKMVESHKTKRNHKPKKSKQKLTKEERLTIAKNAGPKISASLTGKKKGPMSEKTKEKLKLVNTGKTVSAEVKQKISAAHKGKPKSEEHNRKNAESNRGRRVSEETRFKMIESAKTRTRTHDYSKNSQAMKGRVWWNNGLINKREKEQPGPEWVRGQLITPAKEP